MICNAEAPVNHQRDSVNGFSGDFVVGSQGIKETRAAEDEWLQAARMHDFNFRNEHHHLLSSLGSDSGYLGGTNPADNAANDNKFSTEYRNGKYLRERCTT
ncbi:hypothetical protein EVAR_74067_1 [Eumeta japonica]|uniref:Uncharacterized protein n=1 Tax=Eumeta variegata TaxID=151549 RepID=A0A4C1THY5_EUMVA|nr:hypothetical protein EVAR_74067_1 [Eumeta japonica]